MIDRPVLEPALLLLNLEYPVAPRVPFVLASPEIGILSTSALLKEEQSEPCPLWKGSQLPVEFPNPNKVSSRDLDTEVVDGSEGPYTTGSATHSGFVSDLGRHCEGQRDARNLEGGV